MIDRFRVLESGIVTRNGLNLKKWAKEESPENEVIEK